MNVIGIIYSVNKERKIIGIYLNKKVYYYSLTTHLHNKFKKYLYVGNYVNFKCDPAFKIKYNIKSFNIIYFNEIFVPNRYKREILYSKKRVNKQLSSMFDDIKYKMFLDIEMTMPPYNQNRYFHSELLQIAFILADEYDNEILRYNTYIVPNQYYLSDRTKEFLKISITDVKKNSISKKELYEMLKDIIEKYNPAIFIYGKNDKQYLSSFYKSNNYYNLNINSRFLDINQIAKTFLEIKNDPGLFNLYNILYETNLSNQKHNALEDAFVTYKIFCKLKEKINKIAV
ncbi:MAG: exonuclease domain-containing protein [Anaeroplasmataceae bacterium]